MHRKLSFFSTDEFMSSYEFINIIRFFLFFREEALAEAAPNPNKRIQTSHIYHYDESNGIVAASKIKTTKKVYSKFELLATKNARFRMKKITER